MKPAISTSGPSFNATREETILISKIAARAVTLAKSHGVRYSHLSAMMDITAAHNVIPLDLAGLLASPDGDFGHDVFGVRRHLDRATGELGGCFLPRYARIPDVPRCEKHGKVWCEWCGMTSDRGRE